MEVFTRAAFNQLPDGTDTRASFTFEPLARGFGTTIGNAICRTLLSDLPSTAVMAYKVEGAPADAAKLDEIEEDIIRLKLNLKKIQLETEDTGITELQLVKTGPCTVTAGDLICPENTTITDPDQVICTVKENQTLNMTLFAATDGGYKTAGEIEKNTTFPKERSASIQPLHRLNPQNICPSRRCLVTIRSMTKSHSTFIPTEALRR